MRARLAGSCREVRLTRGQKLLSKGDRTESAFFIVEGLIRVFDGETTLAELGPGDTVGEMAAVEGTPRSASADALTGALLLEIERNGLLDLSTEQIDVVPGLIQNIAQRRMRQDSPADTKPGGVPDEAVAPAGKPS